MKCPRCGTDNEAGYNFCVKCGAELEASQNAIEQLDMGGYYSEEDSASGGFTFGSGTFVISDSPSRDSSSDLYTAAELNDSDEEFDFSSFDEPFIPKLDTGRVALPEQTRAVRQAQMNSQSGMQTMPQQSLMQGLPPQGAMPTMPQQGLMQGLPPQSSSPQMSGMPVYGQPVVYPQPQIIGYDQSGMPILGQPVVYGQPQMLGYDQNGMPVYGQPVVYSQPQILGYDQNGMPVYGQPVVYGQPQNGELPDNGGMPIPPPLGAVQPEQPVPPAEDKEKVDVPDDFWEFFDGGKATEHAEMDSADDFFGKRSDDIKRPEKKKESYMNDTPLVDASKLRKNDSAKFNKFFMRSAGTANAEELEAKKEEKRRDYMGTTKNVNADELRANKENRAWNIMGKTDTADADQLQAASPRVRQESLMAQADHAVQAMPKKAKTYNDEIDAIELPEEMKAKKTVKNNPEIPGLPEF